MGGIDAATERRFPCVADLERAALRRLPRFARDYLVGGVGGEQGIARNARALAEIELVPRYCRDPGTPDLSTRLLGQCFDAPFAIAPLGLAGLLWPGCEAPIADAARQHSVLHVLSTFSNLSVEQIGPRVGDHGWFQLYAPAEPTAEADLLARAHAAGYRTLVVTVDIPVAARRERDLRNGMTIPPTFGPATLLDVLAHPRWAIGTLRRGLPDFGNLSPYYPRGASLRAAADALGRLMQGHIDAARFTRLRRAWTGSLVVKGVLDPGDALQYVTLGADALVLSNHGGRQLDAAPAAISMLGAVRRAVGHGVPLLVDGGIRSGLDVARTIAAGADAVLVGRPVLYAAAALGPRGPSHLLAVLGEELRTTMAQLGCATLAELRGSRRARSCARNAGGR